MKPLPILCALAALAVPAIAGSRSGGTGAGAVTIPADALLDGGGSSLGFSGATRVYLTASIGGIGGTLNAATVSNQQGYLPQIPVLPLTLEQALDAPALSWATSGDAAWFPQNSVHHDGRHAARSGQITEGQYCALRTTVMGPGTLTFWWRLSSSNSAAEISLRVDGAEMARTFWNGGWEQETIAIPAGSSPFQTLLWSFENYGADSEAAAWLDEVSYTPSGYVLWASQNIPSGRDPTFSSDWNQDGIVNGVAYVFGNTRLHMTVKNRIPVPPVTPADVNIFLDKTLDLQTWNLGRVSWLGGAAPTFANNGFTIQSGDVVDANNPAKAFYRYRVVQR